MIIFQGPRASNTLVIIALISYLFSTWVFLVLSKILHRKILELVKRKRFYQSQLKILETTVDRYYSLIIDGYWPSIPCPLSSLKSLNNRWYSIKQETKRKKQWNLGRLSFQNTVKGSFLGWRRQYVFSRKQSYWWLYGWFGRACIATGATTSVVADTFGFKYHFRLLAHPQPAKAITECCWCWTRAVYLKMVYHRATDFQ